MKRSKKLELVPYIVALESCEVYFDKLYFAVHDLSWVLPKSECYLRDRCTILMEDLLRSHNGFQNIHPRLMKVVDSDEGVREKYMEQCRLFGIPGTDKKGGR